MGWTGYGLHWHPGDAGRFLIIADETAFPAVRGILDSLGPDARAEVILECGHPADDLISPAAPDTTRVHRVLRDAPDSTAIERAVHAWGATHGASAREDTAFYAWIAGESGMTTGIRRYLTSDLGIPKDRVSFLGYWRRGGPLVG
ncbi:siderophore-interacting protein [uncultured Microbacterium sp.]|uniref:siderophore-interacting protein n=1 Tax=uncultured Microbacterium sp. TaxID=191216 RepID=UPI0025E5FC54|nr:siderophore-interacting protein [uncultured Microbacterium sp.]